MMVDNDFYTVNDNWSETISCPFCGVEGDRSWLDRVDDHLQGNILCSSCKRRYAVHGMQVFRTTDLSDEDKVYYAEEEED